MTELRYIKNSLEIADYSDNYSLSYDKARQNALRNNSHFIRESDYGILKREMFYNTQDKTFYTNISSKKTYDIIYNEYAGRLFDYFDYTNLDIPNNELYSGCGISFTVNLEDSSESGKEGYNIWGRKKSFNNNFNYDTSMRELNSLKDEILFDLNRYDNIMFISWGSYTLYHSTHKSNNITGN